jgi:hypothetical protein
MYHGEGAALCVTQFWREHSGNFVIVPRTGYGVAPRKELCSQRSLSDALQTAAIEPNSIQEGQWKAASKFHGVAWPKRLHGKAA